MKASETWARLRDRVISWNRMRLTRADSLHGILGDLAVCKKERDDIKIEWNRWVQINSKWIADRAECEMARDEALRDVRQLHDAAIETEDKMDALKAERAEWQKQAGIQLTGCAIMANRAEKAEARNRYYEDTLCCDMRIMLEKGGETKAIEPKRIGDLLAERDMLKADRSFLAAALRKVYEGGVERCVNCDRPMDLVLTCPMCGGHDANAFTSPALPTDVAELLARCENG